MKKLIAGTIIFSISLFGMTSYAGECEDLYDDWEACCEQLYPNHGSAFYWCLVAADEAWMECDLSGEITPPPCN